MVRDPLLSWEHFPELVLAIDMVVFFVYFLERRLLRIHMRKFKLLGLRTALALHGVSGFIEIFSGFAALKVGSGSEWQPVLGGLMAASALLVHVPTSFVMASTAWGMPYVSMTGYGLVATLRAHKTAMYVLEPSSETLMDSWLLLHMAIVVRGVAFFVTPWTSEGGKHGDLSIHPIVHSGSIAIAAMAILPMVYPASINFIGLAAIAMARQLFPPRIRLRAIGTVDGAQYDQIYNWSKKARDDDSGEQVVDARRRASDSDGGTNTEPDGAAAGPAVVDADVDDRAPPSPRRRPGSESSQRRRPGPMTQLADAWGDVDRVPANAAPVRRRGDKTARAAARG